MPFAYVVNQNTSTGTLSDEAGKFAIHIKPGDTLKFSYTGYEVTKVFTHNLKDSIRNNVLNIKVYLKQKVSELKSVTIINQSFSKEEKEYYQRKVDEYNRVISSPFTTGATGAGLSIDAIYYAFSKKGKELQKLSLIYQQLLYDEVREHRLSNEMIRNITGNDTLDVKAFAKHCYLSNEFIATAPDYDLYYAVRRCYREYCEMRRKQQ